MPDIILHHYPRSPFAQKIRSILGAKNMPWHSVMIPPIMPKPDVVALTGGYRKTPIMQIGADIYCDTHLIAQVLDDLAPAPPLYPAEQKFNAAALAAWADNLLFPIAVALVFQPKVMEKNFAGLPPEQQKAFIDDRAALRKKGHARKVTLPEAYTLFHRYLSDLDEQLADGREYLLGRQVTIADFAVYHPLWFVRRAPIVTELFAPFANVNGWLGRIDSFGQGSPSELSSTEALAIAKQNTSLITAPNSDLETIVVGDVVEIAPTDYGIDPVTGKLVLSNEREMALRRIDERAGEVTVHFPRFGYEIRKL